MSLPTLVRRSGEIMRRKAVALKLILSAVVIGTVMNLWLFQDDIHLTDIDHDNLQPAAADGWGTTVEVKEDEDDSLLQLPRSLLSWSSAASWLFSSPAGRRRRRSLCVAGLPLRAPPSVPLRYSMFICHPSSPWGKRRGYTNPREGRCGSSCGGPPPPWGRAQGRGARVGRGRRAPSSTSRPVGSSESSGSGEKMATCPTPAPVGALYVRRSTSLLAWMRTS
mmetsp:Transcript_37590/g.118523  ORF Transcript_37590/g.118523 Transcript_37590/m.118523 type:complete len:222 (-) Transcript_37590:873-1538(-)